MARKSRCVEVFTVEPDQQEVDFAGIDSQASERPQFSSERLALLANVELRAAEIIAVAQRGSADGLGKRVHRPRRQ